MASNRDANHIGNFVTFGQYLNSFINNSIPSANIPVSNTYLLADGTAYLLADGTPMLLA